jgi:hypothetical protein
LYKIAENLNIQKQFYHISNKMAELKTEVSVGGGCLPASHEYNLDTNAYTKERL